MSSPTVAPEPAIEVEGLTKRYGRIEAVTDLTFQVRAGEVFGLLGPNGAGKTTTVEILEGYRRADRGSVSVLGLDPDTEGETLRPQIGVMLQDGGLHPGLRPREALELFAAFYEDADDPERVLDVVGLHDVAQTPTRRLSGGQRQRLSLALALIGRPRLFFLDEPTAGMDPHARAATWQLVRELRSGGATILLTTHGMDEAEQLCDRCAIVDRGHLVALGSPTELTSKVRAEEVRFWATSGLDVDDLATKLGLASGGVVEERAGEYVVWTAATPELVADLTAWLRDQHVTVGELRAGRRSLEQVFLRLTGHAPT